MKHNRIDQRQWGHILPVYLTSRVQASYSQVQEDTLEDYSAVKETMLESLGDMSASADRRWWTLSRWSGEDIGAYYLRVHATGTRRIHGLKTREEISEMIRFLSTLPPDYYNSVIVKLVWKRPDMSRSSRSLVSSPEGIRHGGLVRDNTLRPA